MFIENNNISLLNKNFKKKAGTFSKKKSSIQKTILTLNKDIIETATDLLSNLDAGEYYISMAAKSTKANDTGSVFYNVTATLDSSVASALDMPMAAAAYADSVQDKLFGELDNGLLA